MIFSNYKLLVIDDSLTIRHQVKTLFKKYEIDVLEAFDKKTMLAILRNTDQKINLVIMDLNLKYESGIELMQILRQSECYKDVPIIVLTGDSKKETVLKCSGYHINFYAIKPINPKDLALKVLTAMDTYSKTTISTLEDQDAIDFNDKEAFIVKNLSESLKKTHMSKINQTLDVDLSSIKKHNKWKP